ncbi:hypothetical protein EUZ85_01760 [Hahella sp. KA22]|uniref:hypothetical protein n=1 Tax=Hahella sp. KA22 TaxID=1628392 RepID=UPI000FDDDC20|nr:hypothetical protein [Hahella sp. KA22]AZZ95221.1 hypothetical protein ENC22_30050 [Hahella sp. KA22]QAY52866.1 hypothetical protein EUZ85_01760 [Hahella sp. KA22]
MSDCYSYQRTKAHSRIILALGLTLSMAATSGYAEETEAPQTGVPLSRPAVLQSVSIQLDQLVFSVKSTGCTRRDDFRLFWEGPDLTVVRLKPDMCRKKAHWATFSLPLTDPELQEWESLYINNPLVIHSGP